MHVAGVVENDFEVRIFDRSVESNTLKKIKRFSPDVVGVSSFTGPNILDGIHVSERVKEYFGENVITVWGGIHPSLLPEQTLENKHIDIVVRGEGEYTFGNLLHALRDNNPLEEVMGIGFKENGRIHLTEEAPLIEDLDALPFPAWDMIDPKKYSKFETPFVTSRGCPHRCAFCYNQKYNRGCWRGMSAERTLELIEYLEGFTRIRRLKFYDDNFTSDRERFYNIMDGLRRDYPMFVETRAHYVNKEFIEKLMRSSDPYVLIGVESGSPRMLERLKKDVTVSQIRDAFKLLNANGIDTTASFMIGLPGETVEDMEKTLRFVDELKPTKYTCCLYTPYPGSPLYDELVESGVFNPPSSLEEWGMYSSLERAAINVSEIESEILEKTYKKMLYKTILNYIRRGRFKDLYFGLQNYISNILSGGVRDEED